MISKLVKAFNAAGTVRKGRVVVLNTSDNQVIEATAATDSLIGVADVPGDTTASVASGERVDVQLEGLADAVAGAAITRGALLSVDSAGRVITAAASAGSNVRTIGTALQAAAAANDIISIHLRQGSFQG
jgi:hypothetical protein